MVDERIQLRNPYLAAALGLLLPGLGHFYQGRLLKSAVYSGCILSLFCAGMLLGGWQPVYSQVISQPIDLRRPGMQPDASVHFSAQLSRQGMRAKQSYGYLAQVLVGLPAFPALIQQSRTMSDANQPVEIISDPIESEFQGVLRLFEADASGRTGIPVTGTLSIAPGDINGAFVEFSGREYSGEEVSLKFRAAMVQLGRPVFGSPKRAAVVGVAGSAEGTNPEAGELEGYISRSFVNYFQAPRDELELGRLHATLSQRFDLALVCTWIAGLLNLMAIWDAFDGPAYGYGDEQEEPESPPDDPAKAPAAEEKKPDPAS